MSSNTASPPLSAETFHNVPHISSPDIKVKICHTIAGIDPKAWDDMIDGDVKVSHGWLKTIEDTFIGDVKTYYITLEETGRVIGGALCYLFKRTSIVETLDSQLFGKLKAYTSKLGISFLPAFICCPIFSFGRHLFAAGEMETEKRKMVIQGLLNVIETLARNQRLSLSFINVKDEERELVALLEARGYGKALLAPLNYIDIAWSSFAGYMDSLKSISKNIKKGIKREINQNRKQHVVIKCVDDINNIEDRLYELVNRNWIKYNGIPFILKKGFFQKMKTNLGDDAICYVASKKDVITGVTVVLKRGKIGNVSIIGIDHEKAGNDFTYFNMAYYKPIMDAISDHMERLYYGRGMYELKAKRGCRTSNLYLYYKPFSRLRGLCAKQWFRIVSMRNSQKIPKS